MELGRIVAIVLIIGIPLGRLTNEIASDYVSGSYALELSLLLSCVVTHLFLNSKFLITPIKDLDHDLKAPASKVSPVIAEATAAEQR